MEGLNQKVALVTGGANGIGKAIVMELAQQGCHVAIADIDLESAQNTAKAVGKLGRKAIAIKADISNADDVKHMISETLEKFETIHILVNNAGITRDNLLMRMSEDEWDTVIQINLKGAFLCTQNVIRVMMRNKFGKIINISSVIGMMGNVGQCNYAASKAGLIGFTKSVAKEVASKNIQVNAIAPGFIETEMTHGLPDDIKERYLSNIPAKKAGCPEDVARVVTFLSSSASDYITGQTIRVDGGLLIA